MYYIGSPWSVSGVELTRYGPPRWAIVETGYRQGGIDTCSCLFRKTQIIPKETPTNPSVHYAVKDPASERGMRNVSSFFIVCGMPYSANNSILGEGHSGMTVVFGRI